MSWQSPGPTGRRSCGHAPGTADGKSDEELTEEDDLGSADLLAVDRDDWPRLADQIDALYRVGELDGLAAVKTWLTVRGIIWRELTQAPRRRHAGAASAGPRSAHSGRRVR